MNDSVLLDKLIFSVSGHKGSTKKVLQQLVNSGNGDGAFATLEFLCR